MKMFQMLALMAVVGMTAWAMAEDTVHQKLPAERAQVKKDKVEFKKIEGSNSPQVMRMTPDMGQWDMATYWMGLSTPEGKSIIRLRVYNDGGETATFALYRNSKEGHVLIKKIEIPADAPKDAFINLDFPVESNTEWNGIIVKKFVKTAAPSIWIDEVSVLIP